MKRGMRRGLRSLREFGYPPWCGWWELTEMGRPVHALQARPSEAAPSITALEVAKTILFLVSDQARTINGVSLPVDKAWGVV